MTLGAALAIIAASLLLAIGTTFVSRAAAARKPLFHDPGRVAEGRNDLMFAVAILLGFLLLIAMNHYQDSNDAALGEARTVVALAATADGLADRELRETIQHDAVCYLRAAGAYDWAAGDSDVGGAVGGSLRGDYRLDELSRSIASGARAGVDVYPLQESARDIWVQRGQRLFPGTPFTVALWVISSIAVALLIVMAAMLLTGERVWVQLLLSGSTALILAFMLVLIAAFSNPFSNSAPLPSISRSVVDNAITEIDRYTNGNPAVMRSCRTTEAGDGG